MDMTSDQGLMYYLFCAKYSGKGSYPTKFPGDVSNKSTSKLGTTEG